MKGICPNLVCVTMMVMVVVSVLGWVMTSFLRLIPHAEEATYAAHVGSAASKCNRLEGSREEVRFHPGNIKGDAATSSACWW